MRLVLDEDEGGGYELGISVGETRVQGLVRCGFDRFVLGWISLLFGVV